MKVKKGKIPKEDQLIRVDRPRPAHTIPFPGQEKAVLIDDAKTLRGKIDTLTRPTGRTIEDQAYYLSLNIIKDLNSGANHSRLGRLRTALKHNPFMGAEDKAGLSKRLELLGRVREGARIIANREFTPMQAQRFIELANELNKLFPKELAK